MAELRSCDAGSTPIGGSQLAAPASGGGGGSSNSSNASTNFNNYSGTLAHKKESCQNNTAAAGSCGNSVFAGGRNSSGRRNSDTVSFIRTTNNSASAALSIPTRYRGHSGSTNKNCDTKVSISSTSPAAVTSTAKSSRDSFLSTVASTSHLPPRKRKYTALEFSAIDLSVQSKAQAEHSPPASTSSVIAQFPTGTASPSQEEIISSPVTRKQAAIAAAAAAAAASSSAVSPSPIVIVTPKNNNKHARLSLPHSTNNLVSSSTLSGDLDSSITPLKGGRNLRATPSRRSLAATPSVPSVNGSKVTTRRQSLRSPRTSLSLASSPSVSPGRRLTRQSSQCSLLSPAEQQSLAAALHVGTKRRRIASGKSTSSVDSTYEAPSAPKRARRGSSCTSTSSSASQHQAAYSSVASSTRTTANPFDLRISAASLGPAAGVNSNIPNSTSEITTSGAAVFTSTASASQGTTQPSSSSLISKSRRLKATAESTLSSRFALASPSNSITPSSSLSSTSSFNISSSPNTSSSVSAAAAAAAAFFGGGGGPGQVSSVYSVTSISDFGPPNSSVVAGITSANTVSGLNPVTSGSLLELSTVLPLPQGLTQLQASSDCYIRSCIG